jgi:capsule polysaccharide modification protein KpsS
MSVRIASIRGCDKLAKKDFWSIGFRSQGDTFTRHLDLNFDVEEVDCFFQFNILNPYRLEGGFRNPSFEKILSSKKPYMVWEEGSFRQYPMYKKIGWYHYNNTGIFNNVDVDNSRWEKIKKENNITIKDWKIDGEYILIMGQVENDSAIISLYNNGYSSFIAWIDDTITELRKHTDRPIVIRPHPRDLNNYKINCNKIISNSKNVSISENFSSGDDTRVYGGSGLFEDLKNAYAVITYNSNSIVEAICEGIPVFALDQGSVAYNIAHQDLSIIETFDQNIDIQNWCSSVAYTMWKSNETAKGETWAHLKPVFFK